MRNGTGYKWYVVYTKPRHERKIVKYLSDKGIKNYCPTIKTLKQWSDRKKKVEEPLFKSYVFVNVSEREYFDVLNTPGVVMYITFNGRAASIPDKQIEIIRGTLSSNVEFEITTKHFQKGELVEIREGHFAGVTGEIIQNNGKNRLLIRISHIEYSLLVHVSGAVLSGMN